MVLIHLKGYFQGQKSSIWTFVIYLGQYIRNGACYDQCIYYPFHTRNLGRPECAFIALSVRHECTHFISPRDECGVEKAPSNLPLPQVWWRDEGAFISMRLQSRSTIIMWTTMAQILGTGSPGYSAFIARLDYCCVNGNCAFNAQSRHSCVNNNGTFMAQCNILRYEDAM